MKIGRLEIFHYTNCPRFFVVKTVLKNCVDYDWAWWTFRIHKKELK